MRSLPPPEVVLGVRVILLIVPYLAFVLIVNVVEVLVVLADSGEAAVAVFVASLPNETVKFAALVYVTVISKPAAEVIVGDVILPELAFICKDDPESIQSVTAKPEYEFPLLSFTV